ncbi:uncharacterized protein LOC132702758 [Cylas formicarius]|uniref:uncharacterized protein LOC132702758 n=1 Tax=Cylas formicarius TaxID=197179 RepID=UPI0029586A21|nr:uncharacterized protein LOC132702758 [Cylas formicarius]
MSQFRMRKMTKPKTKKVRRRVKRNLNQLKQILLNCDPGLLTIKRDGPRQGKMEKVDILEMTIDHLKQLTRKIEDKCENNRIANRDADCECVSEKQKHEKKLEIWRPWLSETTKQYPSSPTHVINVYLWLPAQFEITDRPKTDSFTLSNKLYKQRQHQQVKAKDN